MLKHSGTAKEAVDNYSALFFEIMIARRAKADRWKCKEPPKTCEAVLRAVLRESLKKDGRRLRDLTDYLAVRQAELWGAPSGSPADSSVFLRR